MQLLPTVSPILSRDHLPLGFELGKKPAIAVSSESVLYGYWSIGLRIVLCLVKEKHYRVSWYSYVTVATTEG